MAIIDIEVPYESEIIKQRGRVSKNFMRSVTIPVELNDTQEKMHKDAVIITSSIYNSRREVIHENRAYNVTDDGTLYKYSDIYDLGFDKDTIIKLNTINDLPFISQRIVTGLTTTEPFYGYKFDKKLLDNRIEDDEIKKIISDNKDENIKSLKDNLTSFDIFENRMLKKVEHDLYFSLKIDFSKKYINFSEISQDGLERLEHENDYEFIRMTFKVEDMDLCIQVISALQNIMPDYTVSSIPSWSNHGNKLCKMQLDFQALDVKRKSLEYLYDNIFKYLKLKDQAIIQYIDHDFLAMVSDYNDSKRIYEDNKNFDTLSNVIDKWEAIYTHKACERFMGKDRLLPDIMQSFRSILSMERDMSVKQIDLSVFNTNETILSQHSANIGRKSSYWSNPELPVIRTNIMELVTEVERPENGIQNKM